MEIGPESCQEYLRALQPHIANYGWMWKLLQARFRKTGWFPSHLHHLLRRLGRTDKPFFVARTADGIAFVGDYRDAYAARCAVNPAHDAPLLDYLKPRLEHLNGALLDIGANIGIIAATIATLLQEREEVLAFEPSPETAACAAATFALNDLKRVRLFPIALGSADAETAFFTAPGHSEEASLNRGAFKAGWVETKVSCRSLDSLMQSGVLGPVGLLKIDVEGHEPEVVRGAKQVLKDYRPDVIFEYHAAIAPRLGWSATDVTALIEQAGRYRFHIIGEGQIPFPPPSNLFGFVDICCESQKDEE
jgi:FkbM family methyltransferase